MFHKLLRWSGIPLDCNIVTSISPGFYANLWLETCARVSKYLKIGTQTKSGAILVERDTYVSGPLTLDVCFHLLVAMFESIKRLPSSRYFLVK